MDAGRLYFFITKPDFEDVYEWNCILQHLVGNEKIKGFSILADKSSTRITDVYPYVHFYGFVGINY